MAKPALTSDPSSITPRSVRSSLLLDEFDSIAKRRDDDADVGELKRLVTVILQTIDDWSPTSLLVAATNHGELFPILRSGVAST